MIFDQTVKNGSKLQSVQEEMEKVYERMDMESVVVGPQLQSACISIL